MEENKEIEYKESSFKEPKNGKSKIWIFIILGIVILGVGAFFAYNYFTGAGCTKCNVPEEKKEEEKEEQKEEEKGQEENKDNDVDIDYETYQQELEKRMNDKIASYHKNETSVHRLVMMFIDKYLLGGLYYAYADNENPSEPSSELEDLARDYIVWGREKAADNNITEDIYNVTKEDMDTYFQEVFNVTPTKYQNIMCEMDKQVLYFYKDGKFVYNENHGGHGTDLFPYFTDYQIIDYKEEGNNITIQLILLSYDDVTGYKVNGKDDEDAIKEVESDELYSQVGYIDYFHNHIEKYKKNGVFEYSFEKRTNGFTLKSFKIVK